MKKTSTVWQQFLRRVGRRLVPTARPVRRCWYRPCLEWLEDRTLFAGHTAALNFTAFQTAHVAGYLATANDFDLYTLHLKAGDRINAAVSAQASGGALQSVLRIFDHNDQPLALDDQEGGDPRLTFQAPAAGDYIVGISSAGDDAYDTAVAVSGKGGATTGLFALDLTRTPGAPLEADLAGSSFRLATNAAAYGDTVSGTFAVENRGGASAGAFQVQLLLSGSNLFTPSASLVLQTFSQAGLGAGRAYSPGGFTVTLPDAAVAQAAGLPSSGPVYLGLRIVPTDLTQDAGTFDKSGVHRGEDWETLTVVAPVPAGTMNLSLADANLNTRAAGTLLTAGQVDTYSFSVSTTLGSGRLRAEVKATSDTLAARLTLSGPNGQVLIQSDDGSIVQHMEPGTYYLSVSAASGAGSFRLISEFVQGSALFDPVSLGFTPSTMVVADLNGDGIPDLITASSWGLEVAVLLGNGDGTFQPQRTFAVGSGGFGIAPGAAVVADVNGDGKPDLVFGTATGVSVLLGNGDGTFQPQKTFAADNHDIYSVAVADVNGDGKPDIITGNYVNFIKPGNTISVLLGNGDGTFQPERTFAVGSGPKYVTVADVNGDGKPDIITANTGGDPSFNNNAVGTVSVLLGNGDGTFQTQQTFAIGSRPDAVVVADLNGDDKPDLVVTNVGVLLGNGDGTFQPQRTFGASFFGPVAVADVNGDGKFDLVVSGTVSVLLGNGDGTFQPLKTVAGVITTSSMAVADVNGDGKPDLVFGTATGVGVVLGNGDSTFQSPQAFAVGAYPFSVAVADVNGDGKPDLVTANLFNTVSVLLANGDGTFQPQRTFTAGVGAGPVSVAVADVNGDGKPDIVTANSNIPGTVSVFLANGDGTFQPPQTFAVGAQPESVAVVDLNRDGKPDLVVANFRDNTVSVLLGNGDGTFQAQRIFAAGAGPISVAVADVNGDGKPDLVIADPGAPDGTLHGHKVSVLLGNGDGTFQTQKSSDVGSTATSLLDSVAVADINGDGKPDLVVAVDFRDNTVSVLLGNGDGTFQPQRTFAVGAYPDSVAVADINGDGKPDIATANSNSNNVSVLLGNGDGSFQPQRTFAVGAAPDSVAVADVNGDGKPDLVTANQNDNSVSVLLGNGDGTFTPSTPTNGVGLRNTPYLADLDGNGILDSVVLDRSGNILFRKGLPSGTDLFAPPVVLNPGRPARDLTVLKTPTGPAIATADTSFDRTLSGPNHFVYTVSLYTVAAGGTITRATAFSTTLLPTRIAAADLTGNGVDDIVVADSFDNTVQVAFQQADGTFGLPFTLPTGETPSDIALGDVNGDGRKDILVTDQANGTVTVLLNDKTHSFARVETFRAGTSLSDVVQGTTGATVSSLDQSVSLAVGNFTSVERNDLVVVNRGAHSFTVLPNAGNGSFANPQAALTTSTSAGSAINNQPGPVAVGDFNHDGKQDVAILMEDTSQLWVYRGNGDGTFAPPIVNAAGTFGPPTGFSFVPGANGIADRFLIGNAFGDILALLGDGTGHFAVDRGKLNGVLLAVGQTKDGRSFAVVADQKHDQLLIYFRKPGTNQFEPPSVIDSREVSLLAPGAVQLADLNNSKGQTPSYLIVASQLGNDVLVYPGRPDGTFGVPASYPVGVAPVAVTIKDLNGDGVPDLAVVDQGSNAVSILFGAIDPQTQLWTATPGPRLNSGGSGPIGVAVHDSGSPHGPDLLVTNSDGKVVLLPGIGSGGKGSGFFQDGSPQTFDLGRAIAQSVFDAATGQLFLVGRDGSLNLLNGDSFVTLVARGVTTLDAADAVLVAGFDNGSIGLLGADGTLLANEQTEFTDVPSALQVLRDGNRLDVFATQQGSDVPIIVSFVFPIVTELLAVAAVAEATTLPGPELVLVATLLSDELVDNIPSNPSTTVTGVPGVEVFAVFVPAVAGGTAGSGGEEGVVAAPVVAPAPEAAVGQSFPAGVNEALQQHIEQQRLNRQFERLLDSVQDYLRGWDEMLPPPLVWPRLSHLAALPETAPRLAVVLPAPAEAATPDPIWESPLVQATPVEGHARTATTADWQAAVAVFLAGAIWNGAGTNGFSARVAEKGERIYRFARNLPNANR